MNHSVTTILRRLEDVLERTAQLEHRHAGRADCVMLNKGPHVLAAVRMLKKIRSLTGVYRDRSVPLLPTLFSSLDTP
jgi:hypothetical protein